MGCCPIGLGFVFPIIDLQRHRLYRFRFPPLKGDTIELYMTQFTTGRKAGIVNHHSFRMAAYSLSSSQSAPVSGNPEYTV